MKKSLIASLVVALFAAAPVAYAAPTEQPLSTACKTTKWNFEKQGLDPADYKTEKALRAAVLQKVKYDPTKVGSAIVYDYWNDRVREAVDCGFITGTVLDQDKKPGLNAIVPCGMLDKTLANEGIHTSEYTHAELSKKLRTINQENSPLLRIAGIEYFDDIADRALECGLVAEDTGSSAGSSKFFDTSSATTELMSSLSSRKK